MCPSTERSTSITVEWQRELEKHVDSLFELHAAEYVLDAVVASLYKRATSCPRHYKRPADKVQEALVEFCKTLPGYAWLHNHPDDHASFRPGRGR